MLMSLFNNVPRELHYPNQVVVPESKITSQVAGSESCSVVETPGDAENSWTDSSIDMSGSGLIDKELIGSGVTGVDESLDPEMMNSQQLKEVGQLVDLFYRYCDDSHVDKDYFKAIECYEKIAELEDVNSNVFFEFDTHLAEIHNTVGYMYSMGIGTDKNLLAAEACFKRAAYKYAHEDAYSNLGSMYQRYIVLPDGIQKNDAMVLSHYRVAIRGGVCDTQTLDALDAVLLYNHEIEGFTSDLVEQCVAIGDMFWYGIGVVGDEEKANAWYDKANKLSVHYSRTGTGNG